ncbi:hypothetical protein BaRGS_00021387 [Batillaria attramentaria]|uniref:Uncharacterized protein n=1 Tax=Batillaria attramentaria TaxID=370345 RepID=A0ABD0KJR4_9CAEN
MSAYDQGPNCLEGKIRAQCAIPHPASRHSDRLDRSFSSSKDLSRFSMDGKMDYLYNQPKRKYRTGKTQALSTMNERKELYRQQHYCAQTSLECRLRKILCPRYYILEQEQWCPHRKTHL